MQVFKVKGVIRSIHVLKRDSVDYQVDRVIKVIQYPRTHDIDARGCIQRQRCWVIMQVATMQLGLQIITRENCCSRQLDEEELLVRMLQADTPHKAAKTPADLQDRRCLVKIGITRDECVIE